MMVQIERPETAKHDSSWCDIKPHHMSYPFHDRGHWVWKYFLFFVNDVSTHSTSLRCWRVHTSQLQWQSPLSHWAKLSWRFSPPVLPDPLLDIINIMNPHSTYSWGRTWNGTKPSCFALPAGYSQLWHCPRLQARRIYLGDLISHDASSYWSKKGCVYIYTPMTNSEYLPPPTSPESPLPTFSQCSDYSNCRGKFPRNRNAFWIP